MPFFFILGIVFIPVGIGMLVVSEKTKELVSKNQQILLMTSDFYFRANVIIEISSTNNNLQDAPAWYFLSL